jgi:hypothetical protein
MGVITSKYPLGYKVNHFRQARRLSLASAQQAGSLWEFRWGTTLGHQCFINRIQLTGLQNANATAEELRFSLYTARQFTAIANTNVASILRSGDNQKLNGDTADSVLTAFVESNAATAPSGGTKTLDSDPICVGSYYTLATATTAIDGADDIILDLNLASEDYQLLRFEKDEGFVITLDANKGATTGFIVTLEVAWAECLKPQ